MSLLDRIDARVQRWYRDAGPLMRAYPYMSVTVLVLAGMADAIDGGLW